MQESSLLRLPPRISISRKIEASPCCTISNFVLEFVQILSIARNGYRVTLKRN